VTFPRDVHRVVNRHGREYFYYAPRRGTKNAGKRIPLGSDTADPEFWRLLRDAARAPKSNGLTFSSLIDNYRQHRDYQDMRPASRRGYNHFLNRLKILAGDRLVAALTRRDVYQLLDDMSAPPRAANFMLSVLRTIIEWGVKRGYRDDNPAVGVKPLKMDDGGHAPWSEVGFNFVMAHAPVHLQRMAFLGRATGQRVSDLVKMRPTNLVHDGIALRIGKLRDKAHIVPLTKTQMATIASWGVRDLEFFITTPGGKRCTETYLNKLWNAWRESDEAKPIRELALTIHGLRATKIRDLRHDGVADGSIADELCMSAKMVARYLRFDDKVAAARASRDRREQKQDVELAKFVNPKPGL
jgi:integrase